MRRKKQEEEYNKFSESPVSLECHYCCRKLAARKWNASTVNHNPPRRLLSDLAMKKATKDLGYYLAVTTLERIGEGKVGLHTGDVLFPVVFNVITFKIFKGEILEGIVHEVLKHGVFMRCGPIENVYLSNLKMPAYHYVPVENPCFMKEQMSKVGKDVVVRFVVIGTKWMEAEREFQALVSLEGDYLGSISSPDI